MPRDKHLHVYVYVCVFPAVVLSDSVLMMMTMESAADKVIGSDPPPLSLSFTHTLSRLIGCYAAGVFPHTDTQIQVHIIKCNFKMFWNKNMGMSRT